MKNYIRGQRVLVKGKSVFRADDVGATVINVYEHSLKVWLDDGRKFYVIYDSVQPLQENM